MKKMPILIVSILVLSGIGAAAIDIQSCESEITNNRFMDPDDNISKLEFTHTVFAEYATATWCPPCKNAHGGLKQVYQEGQYPFYYVSFVYDINKNANKRLDEYNVYYIPDVFIDGGYQVHVGANSISSAASTYTSSIVESGSRPVFGVDIELNVVAAGDASMYVEVKVINNEVAPYSGHLRVYVTEIESSMEWRDHGGELYTFPLLDYAFDEGISVNGMEGLTKSTIWDGNEHNDGYGNDFGSIQHDNIMVIAALFNPEWHQGYAVPDENRNPFDAYWVDDAAGSTVKENNVPVTPSIDGPTTGRTDKEYSYEIQTTEPDQDDIYYYVDWGDDNSSDWIGPHQSGEIITVQHTWNTKKTFTVKVKAKDLFGAESDWATLEMNIPKNRQKINNAIARIINDLIQKFPILEYIIQME